MLAELAGRVIFGGFGSEGEHRVEVFHMPMQVTQLDGANFTATIGKLTGAQLKLQDAESGLKALLAINDRGEASAAAEQIVQIMKTHLSDPTAFVVAENTAGKAELRGKLPVYLLGRAPDGSLVGLKSYVVWT
jgi:Nuclease A inhibitor-like protein